MGATSGDRRLAVSGSDRRALAANAGRALSDARRGPRRARQPLPGRDAPVDALVLLLGFFQLLDLRAECRRDADCRRAVSRRRLRGGAAISSSARSYPRLTVA